MLKHEREELGYANLMHLNNYGIKEVIDAIEGLLEYLHELKVENQKRLIDRRHLKGSFVSKIKLTGQNSQRCLYKVNFDSSGNERIVFKNKFIKLTAEYEKGKQLPKSWDANFNDVMATLGLKFLKYEYNVEYMFNPRDKGSYIKDIIIGKFINDTYYKFWFGGERSGGQDYFKIGENKEIIGFEEEASKKFHETLRTELLNRGLTVEELEERGISIEKSKKNLRKLDLSALELMAIDRRIATRQKLVREESEKERAIM